MAEPLQQRQRRLSTRLWCLLCRVPKVAAHIGQVTRQLTEHVLGVDRFGVELQLIKEKRVEEKEESC